MQWPSSFLPRLSSREGEAHLIPFLHPSSFAEHELDCHCCCHRPSHSSAVLKCLKLHHMSLTTGSVVCQQDDKCICLSGMQGHKASCKVDEMIWCEDLRRTGIRQGGASVYTTAGHFETDAVNREWCSSPRSYLSGPCNLQMHQLER